MTVQSIEIQNFRCFRHSHFENFAQVNLIGGKNNAGKTAFLEAMLLGNVPTFDTIRYLQQLRNESSILYSRKPELAWANLFYQQDKEQKIAISAFYEDKERIETKISCTENTRLKEVLVGKDAEGNAIVKIADNTSSVEVEESILEIAADTPKGFVANQMAYTLNQDAMGRIESMQNSLSQKFEPAFRFFMLPTGYKKPAGLLAREFDEAKLREQTDVILEAFQMIDDSIEKIDTINLGEPNIYVFRKGEKPQPLNFFGDALNKIADLILRVSNNPNSVLLIDEVENGIHHENQQEFWQMLIKLAVAKNVQVFATSHSAEMIKAFQLAAIANQQECEVRYIEMFRSVRTGEIVGSPVDMETLAFDIQNNNPYRGEE